MKHVFFGEGAENLSRRDLTIVVAQAALSVALLLGFFPALRLILWIMDIRG